ncbi:hypothetical protein [Maricurvus nonylphenolicus]|uniref:hypothetical protein n=1 Tax=Maricurvus nonylphenolicus TaxID=1008307 RepID=UPI0036F21C2A
MSGLVVKRIRVRWFYALAAIVLLFLAGLLISLLISSGKLTVDQYDDQAWMIWRVLFYGFLIGLWPVFIKFLLKKHRLEVGKEISRLPVIILIALYEILIVQNPLKALFGFWSS